MIWGGKTLVVTAVIFTKTLISTNWLRADCALRMRMLAVRVFTDPCDILTGKYPARLKLTQFIGGHAVGRLQDVPYFHALPQSEYALANALRDGGYHTWHVGKWHLGEGWHAPEQRGFDVNIGGFGWGMPHNGYFAPFGPMPGLEDAPEGAILRMLLLIGPLIYLRSVLTRNRFFCTKSLRRTYTD